MNGPTRCLVDLDGVLADFVGGTFRLLGKPVPDSVQWNFVPDDAWKLMGFDFWANLDPTPEFHHILSAVEERFARENICILTSPCDTPGCADGKIAWIQRHLPAYRRRFLIGPPKQFCAGDGNVLIDDADHNVRAFCDAGGWSVLIPRSWNALAGRPVDEAIEQIRSL